MSESRAFRGTAKWILEKTEYLSGLPRISSSSLNLLGTDTFGRRRNSEFSNRFSIACNSASRRRKLEVSDAVMGEEFRPRCNSNGEGGACNENLRDDFPYGCAEFRLEKIGSRRKWAPRPIHVGQPRLHGSHFTGATYQHPAFGNWRPVHLHYQASRELRV